MIHILLLLYNCPSFQITLNPESSGGGGGGGGGEHLTSIFCFWLILQEVVENNKQKQTSEVRLYIEPVGKGWRGVGVGWGGWRRRKKDSGYLAGLVYYRR